MPRIVERLWDTPAIVFSRSGEALGPAGRAVALFGSHTNTSGYTGTAGEIGARVTHDTLLQI